MIFAIKNLSKNKVDKNTIFVFLFNIKHFAAVFDISYILIDNNCFDILYSDYYWFIKNSY